MKLLFTLVIAASILSAQVTIIPEADVVHVTIDGKPFTDFYLKGGESMKPYLHPLRSASGKIVTRHFPMETVAGEPVDHPHQRSLWFAHDNVNGFDFWNNEANYKTLKRGRITVEKITGTTNGKNEGTISAVMSWKDPEGNKLLDEARVMTFRKTATLRMVDMDITVTAATKVTFGDSKDGVLGVRLAASLQEGKNSGRGITDEGPHTGTIMNAEGQLKEPAVWGKPSNWMDYSGEVEGEKVGVTIFDHPKNSPRARWHVRAYGLFAANPFGSKTFNKENEAKLTELDAGGTLRLRYRIVIHPGDGKSAGLEKLWADYTK